MDYDVVVVGAGPGGSTAARQCALRGLKTLLLEKEKLPRYKACGGAFSEKAASLLDFKIKEDLIERECFGVRVHYGEHKIEARKPHRLAILTSRDKLDFYLSEKALEAGVDLHDYEKVRSLDVQDSHIIVKTDKKSYKASVVVGADGVKGIVSKYVREGFKPTELALALEAEIPYNVDDMEDSDLIDIDFGCAPGGYGWVFPKREHLSVGTAGLLSRFKEPKRVFSSFLKKKGLNLDSGFHAHLIPAGGYERKTCSDRILLVGDAAGYVDPFLGEGIQYAIHSGRIAANVISESHENSDFSEEPLSDYNNKCYDAFGEDLKHALKFSLLAYNHSNIFMSLAVKNSPFIDKYLDIAAGRTDYREYSRWILLWAPYYTLKNLMWRWK